MELSQLKYVLAVAETGNFTRAAARSNIAQPSLSQQIIKLERELGHKLFHRLGRKAVLTEAGIAFTNRARQILFEVEDATKELGDSASFERKITVGAISTVAPYLLPTLIRRCRKQFPNVQVNVREDFKANLVRALLDGELDLVLAAPPIIEPNILVEVLWKEPLMLAVPKDHPLAQKPQVTAADLADQTFILTGSLSSLSAEVRRFCGDNHFEPKTGSRCAQVATVKALVGIGEGISILPAGARSPEDDETLAYITLDDARAVREIAVLRHMQRYQSRGAEQFLTLLRERKQETASPKKDKG
ncbi:MAG: LysR family transcriptional regulator [Opitutaceae bacterium]|jgi:LysR family hydrogen peroxide-inducible transcriptional activator